MFLSLGIVLILSNSDDPDEMQHYQSTSLGVSSIYNGLRWAAT